MRYLLSVRPADGVARLVRRLETALTDPDNLALVLGKTGVEFTKTHFRALDAEFPNKLGGRRQHFWRGVGDTVQHPVIGPASVRIVIAHPIIAHKAGLGPAGGRIVPKGKKWLAIPVVKEAYGLSPRSYDNGGNRKLTFVKISDVRAVLLERLAGARRGEKRWRVVYALRKSVNQRPFPRALPDPDKMAAALGKAGADHLTGQVQTAR